MYRDNARQRERHKGRRRKILNGGERGRMKEQEKEWQKRKREREKEKEKE